MRKFKTPVSMFMSRQDVENSSLIKRMIDLGYTLGHIDLETKENLYVFTNHYNGDLNIGYVIDSIDYKKDEKLVNFTNVDVFIALAAMSEGEDFYVGEKVKIFSKNYDAGLFTFESSRIGNSLLYHFVNELGDSHIFTLPNIKKATREEIIEHFKPKTERNTQPEKEFHYKLHELIKEYKGIIYCSEVLTNSPLDLNIGIRFKKQPKKVTRAEIAKLLNVDEFEIID